MALGARALVLALLLPLALAACGKESDAVPRTVTTSPTGSAVPPQPDDGAPEVVYRRWLAALQAHDAEAACAEHAPQFTIDLRYEAILLKRAQLGDPCVDFVAVLWEEADREYEPLGVEVTRQSEEDAELAVDLPNADLTVTMAFRNGAWEVLGEHERAESAAVAWLDAWCDLSLGMSTHEVIELMGEPSGTYTITNGGEPQLYWTRDQYDFRAYLDADPPQGTVIDLVGDYDRLTDSDRGRLTCPELR